MCERVATGLREWWWVLRRLVGLLAGVMTWVTEIKFGSSSNRCKIGLANAPVPRNNVLNGVFSIISNNFQSIDQLIDKIEH